MNTDIHFFGVILDGFGQVLCSQCEQDLAANPAVNIVFVGPVHGPSISCAMCGIGWTDTSADTSAGGLNKKKKK